MVDLYPKSGYTEFMKVKEDTLDIFYGTAFQHVSEFKTQLLKWIGNKQRFAHEIASFFPNNIRTYREPFLGAGRFSVRYSLRKRLGRMCLLL